MTATAKVPGFSSAEVAIAYGALTGGSPAAIHPVPSAKVNFRVLLLEGEGAEDSLLVETIRAEVPDADILRTAGALGALALSGLYQFDLLIVAAPMPADLGGEVLCVFAEHNRAAEVIVTCGELPDMVPTGVRVCVLASADNPLEFIAVLRSCRDRILGAEEEPEESGQFVVVLSRHSPMEVVQLKCLAGATTALDFIRRKGPGGRVWFVRGEVVHAETGLLQGEEALIEMMNWPSGSIVEIEVDAPDCTTIAIPWQSLLMRVAQAADERQAGVVL